MPLKESSQNAPKCPFSKIYTRVMKKFGTKFSIKIQLLISKLPNSQFSMIQSAFPAVWWILENVQFWKFLGGLIVAFFVDFWVRTIGLPDIYLELVVMNGVEFGMQTLTPKHKLGRSLCVSIFYPKGSQHLILTSLISPVYTHYFSFYVS